MFSARKRRAEDAVPVWDGLVRLFHWSLAASFLLSYFFTENSTFHESLGYAALILVAVRVPWGFIGPKYARFSDFVYKPAKAVRYLLDMPRGRAKRYIGHNPPGGWNIVALLAMIVVVTVSGILMNTDMFWGNAFVEDVHYISADVTMALVVLHWCGVLASSIAHRENLVLAMITGRKRRSSPEEIEAPTAPAFPAIKAKEPLPKTNGSSPQTSIAPCAPEAL